MRCIPLHRAMTALGQEEAIELRYRISAVAPELTIATGFDRALEVSLK